MKQIPTIEVPNDGTVQEMVLRVTRTYATKLALEDLLQTPVPSVNYTQLLDYILRFGSALRKLGVQPGAHVALIGENRVQWGISYLTAMVFNYVIVPVDKNLTQNEVFNIAHESDSEVLIFSDTYSGLASEAKMVLKKVKWYINMDLKSSTDEYLSMPQLLSENHPEDIGKLPRIDPDAPAEIIFTSGSLGRAKGVMLSQKNLAFNLVSMRKYLMIYPGDKFLSVLPIHHTYECTCGFLCPLFSGASVHYARSLKTITDDMQKVKPTMMLGVPLLYEKMFRRIYKSINADKTKAKLIKPLIKITDVAGLIGWKSLKAKVFKELHERFGGSIRIFIVGGAAPDPVVAKGLRDFGFQFIQGYGLTETAPILALNRLEAFKDNAAGLPLPGLEVKIDSPDENGIGEIIAKGPSVMLGYYKNAEQTQKTIINGWFYTGDLGYFDSDGFLHISGRKKNVIITKNGKNVFPEEIEDLLHQTAFILESVVYADTNLKDNEVIAALIVPDSEAFIEYSEANSKPITQELIKQIIQKAIDEVNTQLPSFKRIQKFVIHEKEFEKTTTQKIKRFLVKT
ncbi:MAG: AMP-binding protein [Ignavibacteriales bacterium]|nr:AMP-binding protein [Ignavibacteriales bacterium]